MCKAEKVTKVFTKPANYLTAVCAGLTIEGLVLGNVKRIVRNINDPKWKSGVDIIGTAGSIGLGIATAYFTRRQLDKTVDEMFKDEDEK